MIPPVGQADAVEQLARALDRRVTVAFGRARTQPVVDSQRVAAVRSAAENGTFAVNPQRIADKLISLEQALTGAR